MKRERAVALTENLLRNLNAGQDEWPLTLVTEVYVFGSFARGALDPHDLDINVEHAHGRRWGIHCASCYSYGRDPYAIMKRPLTSGKRGYQFVFDYREHADFDMTLLWKRGDNLDTALERLRSIKADSTAGRAPRDSMLPEFVGIDNWVIRPHRTILSAAVEDGAIQIERLVLPDGEVKSPIAAQRITRRWKPTSPLFRAASAVITHLERRGIDPGQCHLHGRDIRDRDTPYFANFGWSHFRSIPHCLTEFGGVEWLEVVHPTMKQPLDCIRILPLDKTKLEKARWS